MNGSHTAFASPDTNRPLAACYVRAKRRDGLIIDLPMRAIRLACDWLMTPRSNFLAFAVEIQGEVYPVPKFLRIFGGSEGYSREADLD